MSQGCLEHERPARRWRVALALVAALLLSSCVRSVGVVASVRTPARLPIRAYPVVVFEAGQIPEERELVEVLAGYLRTRGRPRVETRVVSEERLRAQLARRNQGDQVPSEIDSVYVQLRIRFRDRTQTNWSSMPWTECGPAGCFSTRQPYTVTSTRVSAYLKLRVYSASGRALDELLLQAEAPVDGERGTDAVKRVLAKKLLFSVNVRRKAREVTLYRVRLDPCLRGLEAAKEAHWGAARRLFEEASRQGDAAGLDAQTRAKLSYNWAQALRHDPHLSLSDVSVYRQVLTLLREANALDAKPAYRQALYGTQEDRKRALVLAEQLEAFQAQERSRANQHQGRTLRALPPGYR